MSVFTIFITIIAVLVLLWAAWFIFQLLHYIRSGQYEMDQRLRSICK